MIALSGGTSFYAPIASRFGLSFGGASAPTVPQNFTATAGNQTVELASDPFPGALDYKFYRNLSNDFGTATLLSDPPVAETGFTDSPPAGNLFYYWVTATTSSGETGPSAPAQARAYVTLDAFGSATFGVPSGSWTFGTILFGSSTVPIGVDIFYNGTAYLTDGNGYWENTDTSADATNDSITGAFTVSNNTASAFTFWNTEP